MNATAAISPPSTELFSSFLSAFDTEAVAHARIELTVEEKASLQAFANGGLDALQRKALIPLLAHNTTALEYLADLIKKQETSKDKKED